MDHQYSLSHTAALWSHTVTTTPHDLIYVEVDVMLMYTHPTIRVEQTDNYRRIGIYDTAARTRHSQNQQGGDRQTSCDHELRKLAKKNDGSTVTVKYEIAVPRAGRMNGMDGNRQYAAVFRMVPVGADSRLDVKREARAPSHGRNYCLPYCVDDGIDMRK
eukprot:GHVU01008841.1.p1 GENE.GHVU01008841.1~~GHVU01008841.1.p1  ORF type:complete len:160 (+),score=14.14 GHVU01008841.1:389-868(+)